MGKVSFEHRQIVRTEEMEALDILKRSYLSLMVGYERLGESGELACEAVEQCIEMLEEHIENRANC